MKRHIVVGAILSALVAAPGAGAQTPGGLYVSGSLGLSLPRDADLEGTGIDTSLDSEPDFALAGAIGNAYGNNWRTEAEINYRLSDADSVGSSADSGDVSGFGLMLNGYYDVDTGTAWTPYLGAGLGAARISYDGVSPVGGSRIDDEDWGFAYQAILGLNYTVTTQAGIFGEYRHFVAPDLDFLTDTGVGVDTDFGEHRVMVGLRWSFAAPRPAPVTEPKAVRAPVAAAEPKPAPAVQPPPPEPAAEPAVEVVRRYLVFFDWDRSDLTADARSIIRQAAENSRVAKVTRIEATGHADRSGPDRYNMGLSQRRAEAVAMELIRQGVPAEAVEIRWKGEREPLVQTPDGIREPQNRRVEVLFN